MSELCLYKRLTHACAVAEGGSMMTRFTTVSIGLGPSCGVFGPLARLPQRYQPNEAAAFTLQTAD